MSAFIGFQGLRLVFHGSRSVFMGFQGSRLVFRGSSKWIFISAGTRQLNNRRLIKYLEQATRSARLGTRSVLGTCILLFDKDKEKVIIGG